jgi:ABC-type transport system substrate-binding protein
MIRPRWLDLWRGRYPPNTLTAQSRHEPICRKPCAYANTETAYFANAKAHPPTAANIANFQNTHDISGIATPDPLTIQFTLTAPASDFLYMLAMPFTSARPVEYDSYVPNSLQLDQNTISDGPYQISSYARASRSRLFATRRGSSPPTRCGTTT